MRIGNYNLYSIETSEFGLDGGAMFGIIPKPVWEKQVPSDDLNRIKMVTRSLLLTCDDLKILIDTGNGTKWEEKYKKIYNIDTDRYNIELSLGKYGFSTEDITDVICTHLHFDHVGGNTKIENGKIVPTFPNAKYWVSKENWDLANHPSQKDAGSFMEHDWKVLAENGMVEIVDGHESFIEGIDTYLTYGHTKGLMHPVISDGVQTLFYGADIFLCHGSCLTMCSPWSPCRKKKNSLLKCGKRAGFFFLNTIPIFRPALWTDLISTIE